MRVSWTRTARNDLLAIVRFIAKDNPVAAREMADRLRSRVQQLARYPRSGRFVPELQSTSARELVEPPYRLVYVVLDEAAQVQILSIVHSRRLLGTEPAGLASEPRARPPRPRASPRRPRRS